MTPSDSSIKGSGFDMSIVSESPASLEERKKAIEKMITIFIANNVLEYIYKISPEGATGPELEEFVKKRAKESDPDQETLMLANKVTNNFGAYYMSAMEALIGSGNIRAGEDKKFFLQGPTEEGED